MEEPRACGARRLHASASWEPPHTDTSIPSPKSSLSTSNNFCSSSSKPPLSSTQLCTPHHRQHHQPFSNHPSLLLESTCHYASSSSSTQPSGPSLGKPPMCLTTLHYLLLAPLLLSQAHAQERVFTAATVESQLSSAPAEESTFRAPVVTLCSVIPPI